MLNWFMRLSALLIGMTAAIAYAEVGSSELPSRVELHAIPTVWISDQQFLTGDDKGRQVNVAGELRIAQASGRTPLVILMHGSGGIGPNVPFWARRLNAMGISTLTIDGLSGRGLSGVGSNQATLGRLNLILDIYRSLQIAAAHPRIDANRIALMGFSRGGQAALYASVKRFHKLWNRSGAEFAAYIAFYPDCGTSYQGDVDVADKPIRIFHGTPDDYNPVATCKAFVSRLKAAGRDVELTEYPHAPHGFDNPLGAVPAAVAKDNQSVRECSIRESELGNLINVATGAPFSYQDACVKLNPHVGADPEAREAAGTAITSFLKSTFKLAE
jgi:dienelactone hydrolase